MIRGCGRDGGIYLAKSFFTYIFWIQSLASERIRDFPFTTSHQKARRFRTLVIEQRLTYVL